MSRTSAGLPAALNGTQMPESVLTDPALLNSLTPGIRHWQVESVEPGLHVAIGGARPVAADDRRRRPEPRQSDRPRRAGRASHEELDYRANHDQLTQLPTRTKFFRAVAAAVDGDETGTVALLIIDLDDFKQVNDVYGHAAGDELLVEVAERIATVGGPGSMAARFGGDEFTLLLTGLNGPVQAEQIAELLCARLVAPIVLSNATVKVGASIGVAVTAPGRTAGDLTRCADIAMYSAKAQGKNRIEVFHPDQHGEAAAHRTREKHLARAIECGEIVLRYRPLIAPGTGEPVAVEAHAYWQSPRFGEIGADDLTDLAAHTGNLADFRAHVVHTVCADLAGLPATVRFTLDVSGAQLHDQGRFDMLIAMLAEGALDPARLNLRITGAEPISRLPSRLLEHGVRVVLDASQHPHGVADVVARAAGARLDRRGRRRRGAGTGPRGEWGAGHRDRGARGTRAGRILAGRGDRGAGRRRRAGVDRRAADHVARGGPAAPARGRRRRDDRPGLGPSRP